MSVSELLRVGLAILTLTACDDPSRWLEPPTTNRLTLFLVLDPDSAAQPMVVTPSVPEGSVMNPGGAVHGIGGFVVQGSATESTGPCSGRYGFLPGLSADSAWKRCVVFDFQPVFGATYDVIATAVGRPEARATTMVPGDFIIRSADASGDPPGTSGFEAAWTASEGAYRYLVSIRGENHPPCLPIGCEDAIGGGFNIGWFTTTTDTTISATAAEHLLRGGDAPWRLEVYAVDRALFEVLTSGHDDNTFPVAPIQNVVGGYGVVGSGVRRTYILEDR